MVKVGIDTLSFYTSAYAMDLGELANQRGISVDKFYVGLGQHKMAVPPPGEDIVTMAANAAWGALRDVDIQSIDLLLFATESGIDQSKAAGIYVHDLLKLSPHCRVIELKQACYSATLALQLALPYLLHYPNKKVLLVASDIARYGLGTPGESSQGCGAVAMVLASHPRILALDEEYGAVTENVMDFWRPNYMDAALVEGKYSSKLYLNMLEKAWLQYHAKSKRLFTDHDYFCYHMPVPRLVEKAHVHLSKVCGAPIETEMTLKQQVAHSIEYGRHIGNSYTASLYIGLASLLDLAVADFTGKRVGFYSYGSGCVAEYFSGTIQSGYQKMLHSHAHQAMLAQRTPLTYSEYEYFYQFQCPQDGGHYEIPRYQTGRFRLKAISDHKRLYETCL